MKIVITGALGHIGSKVIRELPSAFPNAEIVLVDNLLVQRYCSLFNLPSQGNYRFLEGDVLKMNLEPIVDGADVLLHLAAITDAAGSFENRKQVGYNNFSATARVAEACKKTKCKMIHLSSTSVYGTQSEIVDENCSAEDLRPQSPYAETKLREEEHLHLLGTAGDLDYIICRFGTICGTSPGMRFHTAVNKFCWQAVMGQPLTVWRTALHQKRPYLTLDDAVAAIFYIIGEKLFDKRVYNVLTDNLTVEDITHSIRCHIPKIDIQYVDSEIMNQLSYEVSCGRFMQKGFRFNGNVSKCIGETIELLASAGGCHTK